MLRLLKKLKYGVNYRSLNMSQLEVFLQLEKAGIIHRKRVGDTNFFELSEGVIVSKNDRVLTFEVRPIITMGILFDYYNCFACESGNKEACGTYFLPYKRNPSEDEMKDFGVGEDVKVKVVARGYDENIEALLLRLPRKEYEYYDSSNKTCLTIGVNNNGMAVNNEYLNYEDEIHNTFIEGVKVLFVDNKAYDNLNQFKIKSKVWDLYVRGDEGTLIPKEDKKVVNR